MGTPKNKSATADCRSRVSGGSHQVLQTSGTTQLLLWLSTAETSLRGQEHVLSELEEAIGQIDESFSQPSVRVVEGLDCG